MSYLRMTEWASKPKVNQKNSAAYNFISFYVESAVLHIHLKLLKLFFIILCFVKYCEFYSIPWCLNIFLSDKKIALNCHKTAWFANEPTLSAEWRISFYVLQCLQEIYVNYKTFFLLSFFCFVNRVLTQNSI